MSLLSLLPLYLFPLLWNEFNTKLSPLPFYLPCSLPDNNFRRQPPYSRTSSHIVLYDCVFVRNIRGEGSSVFSRATLSADGRLVACGTSNTYVAHEIALIFKSALFGDLYKFGNIDGLGSLGAITLTQQQFCWSFALLRVCHFIISSPHT